jgi:hypothetical protein
LFYLGLAIAGVLGFVVIRSRLFAADDPAATLAHLVDNQSLARRGRAGAAHRAHPGARRHMVLPPVPDRRPSCRERHRRLRPRQRRHGPGQRSAPRDGVEVALDPIGDAATTVQLLYLVSGNLWGVGAVFFGLWLIPMGSCVLRSGWMPRPLGWVLVSGGIGYVLSAFIRYLAPEAQVVADALAYPATVGEFWIVIYLLAIGVRRRALDEAPRDAGTAAPAST